MPRLIMLNGPVGRAGPLPGHLRSGDHVVVPQLVAHPADRQPERVHAAFIEQAEALAAAGRNVDRGGRGRLVVR
jgi:hypothetical protein